MPTNSASTRQCCVCGRRRPARMSAAYGIEALIASQTDSVLGHSNPIQYWPLLNTEGEQWET
jgi:hypothetical protein